MNERIKLLASQCWTGADHLGPDWFDQERFARLIIEESAQFLYGAVEVYTQAEQDACDRAAQGLKRHFGVE